MSRWSGWLKLAGVLAGLAASSIGSYQAARSQARTEASASYEALKQAVEHLELNQERMWQVLMARPGLTKSLDDGEPRLRPFPGMRPLPRDFATVQARK